MARRPAGEQGRRQARAWALGSVALLLLVAVPAPASVLPDLSSNACENPLPRSVPACEEWVTISATESVGRAEPFDSVMSADGSTVYAVGDLTLPGSGLDLLVVAYDVGTGDERWTYRFDGGIGGTDRGFAITEDPATGDLFVAGETNPAGNDRDLLVVSLTKDGSERWRWTWSHAAGSEDLALSITFDSVVRVVVVQGMVVWEDLATLHGLDATTGSALWEIVRKDDSGLPQGPIELLDLPGPYVAGLFRSRTSAAFFDVYDFLVSVHHAATGAQSWAVSWDQGLHLYDQPMDLAVSPDGGTLYATGFTISQSTGGDVATVAWNVTTGQELWNATYDGGITPDQGRAVAVSPDGERVFVAGRTESNLLSIAHSASDGGVLWSFRYEDPWTDNHPLEDPGDWSSGASAAVSMDGATVVVGGFSEGWRSPIGPARDIIAVGLDAGTGEQLWANRFNGPGWRFDQTSESGLLLQTPGGERFVLLGYTEQADQVDRYTWVALGLQPDPRVGP